MNGLSEWLMNTSNSDFAIPLSSVLLAISLYFLGSGFQGLRRGMSGDESSSENSSSSEDVIRGIRRGILGIGFLSFAAGIVTGVLWPRS